MRSKSTLSHILPTRFRALLGFSFFCLSLIIVTKPLEAFVHISKVKPRLPVSPEAPKITFQWDGDTPPLRGKYDVFGGTYGAVTDAEMMGVLLTQAMARWNEVESSYLEFEVVINPGVVLDAEDEIYAIVIEDQDSHTVAAAALPSFDSPSKITENKLTGKVIYDCDISVSSKETSAKSLLNTLIHELGHCVGLGHPHSNYHSIMSYANIGQNGELGLDDKAGLSFLYPMPGDSEDVRYLTSCGTIGGRGQGGDTNIISSGQKTGFSLLVLMLLPLLIPIIGRFFFFFRSRSRSDAT